VNQKVESFGTLRRFSIPVTKTNQDYDYPVKVEVQSNGKTFVAESVVKVQSGKTVEVRVAGAESQNVLSLVER
jgi:uncharacterized protein (TIGR03000 family)